MVIELYNCIFTATAYAVWKVHFFYLLREGPQNNKTFSLWNIWKAFFLAFYLDIS